MSKMSKVILYSLESIDSKYIEGIYRYYPDILDSHGIEPKPLNIKSDLADDNAVVPESVLLLIAILGAGVLYLLWRIGEVLG